MVNYKDAIKDTNAYQTVLKDSEANRLSHTYLLVGEDMDYAKEFAKMLSKIILGLDDFSAGNVKLEKDIHPDVYPRQHPNMSH